VDKTIGLAGLHDKIGQCFGSPSKKSHFPHLHIQAFVIVT
jgi:hypothetical protein